MKIFATSDIHGNRVIIDKLPSIANDADLILICGDIGGKGIWGKTPKRFSECQRDDADYLTGVISGLSIPSRFIPGNDDWFEIEGECAHYLSKREQIGPADLIPFEFVLVTPFNTNREVNENKLRYELEKLSANENSIIVAHTPPFGAGDTLSNGSYCGSKSVRAWIEETQPLIWLCGHIHEDNSVNLIGETYIFNCACWYTDNLLKGWLIDTDDPANYVRIAV